MIYVPNLRFREFEGEWEKNRLGEIADIVGGGTPDTTIEEYWNGEIQWFIPSEIKSNYASKSERTITKLGLNKSSAKLLPVGAILLTTRATIGEVAIATEKCSTNQGFQSLIVNKDVNNIFIANWIKQNKNELIRRAKGSTFAEISKSEIERISILLPATSEQIKIAAFLSLLDNRLSTQSQIIDNLQSLMKGMSKKLFSQKVRFKDDNGNNFPDWEIKKLNKVATVTMGQSPDSSSYNTRSVGVPLIQGNADITDRKSNPRQYTNNPTKLCKIGDLLLTVRAPVGYVAKSCHNACIGRGVCSIKNNEHSLMEFIYQFLLQFESNWKSIEQGSTFTSINSSDIGLISIEVSHINEQTKIAKFLSAIDEKLETEKQILKKYTEQKKYLLANLFI